ncbi:ferredoxin--NADP reductase [Nitrospira sp. M1]
MSYEIEVVIDSENLLHFSAMKPSRYSARIEEIRDLAPNIRELTLSIIDPDHGKLHFLPGQAIAVEIEPAQAQGAPVRYYSLASPPSQATRLTLLLSLADQGDGATYLFEQSEGDIVRFQGPHGSFHLNRAEKRNILFVATGTGIAPFLSMLHTLLEEAPAHGIRLVWGLRSERDVYYQNELQALADTNVCFSFVTTLSRAQSTWVGETGRVTELVARLPSVEDLAVYVCGHRTMVNDVARIVRAKGSCPIYQEQFMKSQKKDM